MELKCKAKHLGILCRIAFNLCLEDLRFKETLKGLLCSAHGKKKNIYIYIVFSNNALKIQSFSS